MVRGVGNPEGFPVWGSRVKRSYPVAFHLRKLGEIIYRNFRVRGISTK